MKGDFSRGHTPDRKRGETYRRVLLQQGRVLLDSDIAASVDAQDHLLRELASDVGCAMGSPDLGYVVTPGPLFALFETLDQVSGLPAPGDPFRAHRDHAVRVLDRYPALYLDGTAAAGTVTVKGRMELATAEHPTLRLWARIPSGVKLSVTVNGTPTSVTGLDAATLGAYDIGVQGLGLTKYSTLALGFSAAGPLHEAWIALIEGVRPPAAQPTFWFTAGRFSLDGLSVEHGPADGSYPESTFPTAEGMEPPATTLGLDAYLVAYLEGWERPITAVEDPGILEQALGGALDTTIRTRAMGQVKVALVSTGGLTSADEVGDGVAAAFGQIDRGSAKLTVLTTPSGTDPDPCAIPAASGYTGAENRLYRFEVHTPGNLGTAVLKWSTDNGAVLHAVEVDGDLITVIGRSVLQDGDLVELLDEAVDRGDAAHGAVDLAAGTFTPSQRSTGTLYYVETTSKISQVRLLDLTDKTPVSIDPASKPGLKLRRWSGLCDTSKGGLTKTFPLGEGITITLDGAGFRAGDYWQYEARRQQDNANGPWQASPHGPERLFAPLALFQHTLASGPLALRRWFEHQYSALCELEADDVAYDGAKAGTDATTVQEALDELFTREPIVINGCGDLIVHPDSDLQAVFDAIGPGQDARVCIHPGAWQVAQTVVVADKGHVIVGGAGRGTRLSSQSLACVLRFERCTSVHVHDLSVHGSPTPTGNQGMVGALSFVDCPQVDVERVQVVSGAANRRRVSGIEVRTQGAQAPSARVRIRGCEVRVGHGQTGILVIDAESADIEDNHVESPEEPWSLVANLGDDDVAAWAGSVVMARLAVVSDQRVDSEWFTGSPVVLVNDEYLQEVGLTPDPWGRPMLVTGIAEWSGRGRVTMFSVHPSLDDAGLWADLLEANPMTGWNNRDDSGGPVSHPDGWVLANLRRLRKGIVRAALGLPSPVTLGTFGGRFADLANRLRLQSTVTAGGQGIVVGGRRTPLVGQSFTTSSWNTMYVSGARSPSVSITGNRVIGFGQGIHVGTSYNGERHTDGARDRRRRLRSYRARIHGNVVHLRVPAIARERHGVFVGNAHSVLVTDNLVELVWPELHHWTDQPPLDGIRLWGSYGPLVQVRGNHTVGMPTGIRLHALNPHIATNGGASWTVEGNAYAGFGQPTNLHPL